MENLEQKTRIGSLDERIVVESYTATANEYGELIKTWSTSETLWARVEYINSGNAEKFVEATENEYRAVRFTVRYRTSVSNKNRILYNSEYYDVREIQHEGRKRFTYINTLLIV
jgi:SPP1 family predicted phage head-tail adaptor